MCARIAHIVLTSQLTYFTWDNAKNEKLKRERGVSFEDVVFHMERGDILDIVEHPNQERYRGQRVIIVQIEDYACVVPCVHEEGGIHEVECVVLKTIIPSRKATQKYLHREV
jgi:uncharacterized DUF497 family protein